MFKLGKTRGGTHTKGLLKNYQLSNPLDLRRKQNPGLEARSGKALKWVRGLQGVCTAGISRKLMGVTAHYLVLKRNQQRSRKPVMCMLSVHLGGLRHTIRVFGWGGFVFTKFGALPRPCASNTLRAIQMTGAFKRQARKER